MAGPTVWGFLGLDGPLVLGGFCRALGLFGAVRCFGLFGAVRATRPVVLPGFAPAVLNGVLEPGVWVGIVGSAREVLAPAVLGVGARRLSCAGRRALALTVLGAGLRGPAAVFLAWLGVGLQLPDVFRRDQNKPGGGR